MTDRVAGFKLVCFFVVCLIFKMICGNNMTTGFLAPNESMSIVFEINSQHNVLDGLWKS